MAEHALKRAEAVSPIVGLQTEEVTRFREQYGFNEIEQEKAKSPWVLFVEQFKSPLVIILIFACVLSGGLGRMGRDVRNSRDSCFKFFHWILSRISS
jgi:magnesium-transporting ATPase (P-type)